MNAVNGILHARGKKILNGLDEEILLKGWGLGNWLLPEGYMWLAGTERFDRPRRIEKVIEELTGKEYAESFWKRFRRNYVSREDILYMAELGYNSVRIPINWRVLMEEGPGIRWREEGFSLLEECLAWCEEAGIYAFPDLHGAPGGQTGANIDDSIDNIPRLFIDSDSREKAIALWREIAVRYGEREVIGGYDLLNEPIAPPSAGYGDHDHLIPELEQFYREVIAVIRQVDQKHMFSLEGPHWSTSTCIFRENYDDNMVLHFHRYAEPPQRKALEEYLSKSEELNIPLWLGETGENVIEWFSAFYPLAASLGIGYNLWPWKKMECANSPCSIRKPKGYEKILDYIKGGQHPGYEAAQIIMDEYLENCKLANCSLHPEVTGHVFRQAPFSLLAVDFDEVPGKGVSYSGTAVENPDAEYRRGCNMFIKQDHPAPEKRHVFDSGWDIHSLVLTAGEYAEYTVSEGKALTLKLDLTSRERGGITIEVKGAEAVRREYDETTESLSAEFDIQGSSPVTIRITVNAGALELKRLHFTPGRERYGNQT